MSCRVDVNRHGNLRFRIDYQGREWSEGTKRQRDTARNRQRLEARATLISEEMERGEFDYLKWFPRGNRAKEWAAPTQPEVLKSQLTVREFYLEWIKKKKPPFVRLSLERDYEQSFKKNILPFMGALELNAVTVDTLESFRLYLVEERKLALKTARNIIDGSLRAMIRDAGRKLERNPFTDLPANWWPRLPQREPDPFTEEERDAILAYYRSKRSYKEYAFVCFRFWTGTRPSEAVALKWGSVDLHNAKAMLSLSRHLGEENATKTRASRRTITLLPNVVEMLNPLLPLRVAPQSYVFTNGQGQPIDQSEFNRCSFQPVLRVLKLRPRPFYNLRHTFISVALTLGCNQKWIAEQTGTSVAMIQEHYGKYIRDDGDALLRAYVAQSARQSLGDETKAKTGTFAGTLAGAGANYAETQASPTGFEPVLSA